MGHLGDGKCTLSHNTEEFFFDIGDCCLDAEFLQCRLKFMNQTDFVTVDCPAVSSCIWSNIYCVPEELGDGNCQDHNNGPFCDYDLGDCCTKDEKVDHECCQCTCRQPFNEIGFHPSLG